MPLASPFTDQLTAWSTFAAAFFSAAAAAVAIFAVIAALRAYRAQRDQLGLQQRQLADQQALNAKQTEVLELQASDLRAVVAERQRETEERHRGQAIQVFTWTEPPAHRPAATGPDGPTAAGWRLFVHLQNASPWPIRNIDVQFHTGSHALGPAIETIYLGPGGQGDYENLLPGGLDVDPTAYGAVIEFNDADGQRWRLNLDGRLEEWDYQGRWVVVRQVPERR